MRTYEAKIETTLDLEKDGVNIFQSDATLCCRYRYDDEDGMGRIDVMAIRFEKTRFEWDDTTQKGKKTVLATTTISACTGHLFETLHSAIDWDHLTDTLTELHHEKYGYPSSADAEHRAHYLAEVL